MNNSNWTHEQIQKLNDIVAGSESDYNSSLLKWKKEQILNFGEQYHRNEEWLKCQRKTQKSFIGKIIKMKTNDGMIVRSNRLKQNKFPMFTIASGPSIRGSIEEPFGKEIIFLGLRGFGTASPSYQISKCYEPMCEVFWNEQIWWAPLRNLYLCQPTKLGT